MARQLYPRLQTFGYPSDPSPPPFSFHITSKQAWQRAKEIGTVTNLVRYRDAEGEDSAQCITYSYTLVFPQAWSQKPAWQPLTAKALNHFEHGLSPFRGDVTALGFTNNEKNSAPGYRSTPETPIVLKNTGFSVRARIAKPPKDQAHHCWWQDWDKWRFEVRDGRATVYRKSAQWTKADEDALEALIALESPTSAQQTTIDTTRARIYEIIKQLNLGSSETWYNEPFVLTFIPEARGLLTVRLEGAGEDIIRIEKIIETRLPGVVWEASPLMIQATDGVFYWQPGYPAATALTGELRLAKYKTGNWTDAQNQMVFNTLIDAPAGTSIVLENQIIDSVFARIVAKFTTNNNRVWPRLYSGHALIPAGPRGGKQNKSFDSADHPLVKATATTAAVSPISEVEINHESSDRRLQVQMNIFDPNGRTFKNVGENYGTVEHRLGTFTINGKPLVTNGVFKEVTQNDMDGATYNQPRAFVTKGGTSITATLSDIWGWLEELNVYGYPIGDRMRLGAYFRLLLQNAGFTTAEMSGVDPNAGRILPGAALGEEPAIVPGENANYAEYLRCIQDRWGMGLALRYGRDGIWYLGKPLTHVVAQFRKTNNLPANYDPFGPIKRIIEPLDLVIDPGDFYNYFKVIGSRPELAREFYIRESVRGTTGPLPKNFIGRLKPYTTVQDDGLRTMDDVVWVLSSLVMKYGKPGRYWEFGAEFSDDYFPGDYVAVENTVGILTRISGASLDDDQQKLAVREAA